MRLVIAIALAVAVLSAGCIMTSIHGSQPNQGHQQEISQPNASQNLSDIDLNLSDNLSDLNDVPDFQLDI